MEVKDIEHTSNNGVRTVSFSLFTQEQLRGLSVKQVTKSVTFDRLGRPQRDGLYDPALGPVDLLERCETCALSYDDCPGNAARLPPRGPGGPGHMDLVARWPGAKQGLTAAPHARRALRPRGACPTNLPPSALQRALPPPEGDLLQLQVPPDGQGPEGVLCPHPQAPPRGEGQGREQ